ncbi:thioesterase domain-containing protein [Nocardia sp. NPDC058658]|uniref:thioesterase domain-containing protein n=1 Tax=Nocardia sp. NPDC058658 TaxID=3346580 RepID=UPI00365C4CB4
MRTRDDLADPPSTCGWTPDRPDVCPVESDDERAASTASDIVLPIRPRSTYVDGDPLFCLAGEAVLAWNYASLVTHLDPRVPIYGLQASPEPRTIREYATRYLTEIRRIAPHGPYQLLGWSAGGLVAHEIAVRLREAGEHVRIVLLATDPAAPTPAPLSVDGFARLLGADLGSDLGPLADLSAMAAHMVTGHRPAWLPGDLTVCIAGREPDGTDRLDPAATVRNWRPYVEGPVTGYVIDATPDELTTPDLLPEIARILATTPPATC